MENFQGIQSSRGDVNEHLKKKFITKLVDEIQAKFEDMQKAAELSLSREQQEV